MPRDAFATDPATHAYYDARAREYDEWYLGVGQFAERARAQPEWHTAVEELVAFVRALPPARTLDVACGSGFLTRHLRGTVVGLDQSPNMVAVAQERMPDAVVVRGDALALPFADGAFDRVFTGHFYGHLPPGERERFLAEARRVGRELVVVDTGPYPGRPADGWQERTLNDGSRHRVYKRFLSGPQLAAEIGGEVLLDGAWFSAARAGAAPAPPRS